MEPRRRPDRHSHGDSMSEYDTEPLIEGDESRPSGGSLKDEWKNIALLLFLYVLQGVPLGLAAAVPMFLQNRNVSYREQAIFSFVHWPFSVKLLWAPIVDSFYSQRFGRRKSWLVPVQYAIGIFLLVLSYSASAMIGERSALGGEEEDVSSSSVNVLLLTCVFFALNFLAATQDIAVDGWALTMLSRKNVGYASTCNSVGQTAGYFLGNVLFLALESPEFVNTYLRSKPQKDGLVTFDSFIFFWSIVFLVTTTLVALMKHEREHRPDDADDTEMGVVETYRMAWKILRLPAVQTTVIVLMTCKIGFSVTDGATALKLIEAGVHKENLALLAIPMIPLQILLPLLISRYTCGPRPLDVFLKVFPARLAFCFVFMWLLHWTHLMKRDDGSFPVYYYVVIVLIYAMHQVTVYSIFVSLMAFHAKVSDPAIGGTYMTLLNTLTNLGSNWPSTLALWMLDGFTYKECSGGSMHSMSGICYSTEGKAKCTLGGGTCETTWDGYYIETVIAVFIGFVWLYGYGKKRVEQIQSLPPRYWRCTPN